MWTYLLTSLALSVLINIAMFLVAFRYKTDKLTDASYAISFIVLAVYGLIFAGLNSYRLALFAMILIWAVRLGGFLLMRIWRTGKDSRFDEMRNNFFKFGQFWLLQALSVWVILIATLLALRTSTSSINTLAVIGVGIWFAGLIIEATADFQKYRFSSDPSNKGRWISSGIWKYSRHPNYFGEILVWSGVYLYTIQSLPPTRVLFALVSPVFIAILLLFVSGVPILEKSADERWGSDANYLEYKSRTSILITWPPSKW